MAQWELIGLEGGEAGRRYPLSPRSRLGRNPGLEIVIDDPQASRQHALIQCEASALVVTDLGSKNGTFVNGARISRTTWLNDGDTIRVGNTWLQVVRQERPSPAPAPPTPPAPTPPRGPGHAPWAGTTMPSEPPIDAEPIVGIVTGLVRRKGVLGMQAYNLIVTPDRLVFDRITNETLRDAVAQAREAARVEGRGFIGQWAAQAGALDRLARQYLRVPIETVLERHPDNFTIALSQIRKISLRVGDAAQNRPPQLVVRGPSRLRFDLRGTGVGQAQKLLRQVLGARVR